MDVAPSEWAATAGVLFECCYTDFKVVSDQAMWIGGKIDTGLERTE